MLRRSSIIVVSVFLVLTAFAFFWERSDIASNLKITPSPTAYRLFSQSADQVRKVSILFSGSEFVAVRADSQAWQVIKPLGSEPAGGAVEELVVEIIAADVVRILPASLTNVEMGVADAQQLQIEVNFSSGASEKVIIGNLTDTNSGYYARSPNNDAVLLRKGSVEIIRELVQQLIIANVP